MTLHPTFRYKDSDSSDSSDSDSDSDSDDYDSVRTGGGSAPKVDAGGFEVKIVDIFFCFIQPPTAY